MRFWAWYGRRKRDAVPTEQEDILDDSATQYRSPGPGGPLDIVVGLDFGTSTSKVVVRLVDLPGNPAFAVDFSEACDCPVPYLAPTRVWMTEGGVGSLRRREGAHQIDGIKVGLFEIEERYRLSSAAQRMRASSVEREAQAVVYLALVLRHARAWFLSDRRTMLDQYSILRWSCNLGVPSVASGDNDLHARFRRVGAAAWLLSQDHDFTLRGAQTTLGKVDAALASNEESVGFLRCDFAVVPEVVAASYGYAVTPRRRKGVHVLVDVGASTLDVCVFILFEIREEMLFTLLTADVEHLGTLRYHFGRVQAAEGAGWRNHEAAWDYDPLRPLPADAEVTRGAPPEVLSAVEKHRMEFVKDAKNRVAETVCRARRWKDPKANAWRRGHRLPILVIGGGSRAEVYESVVGEVQKWAQAKIENDGTEVLRVPLPVDFAVPKGQEDDSTASDREYLSVAWGLSHRKLDIGRIRGAESPDMPLESIRDWRGRYVGKEQV